LLAQKISFPSSDINWQALQDCRTTPFSGHVTYWSVLLLQNLFLSFDLGTWNILDVFSIPISSFLTAFTAFAIFILPTFCTFFRPSTTQNSESLENQRDEVLRLISSPNDIRTACGDDIRNTGTKKIWQPANC
jgi:hypothetical protein